MFWCIKLISKGCCFEIKGKTEKKKWGGGFLQNVHIPVATVAWAWRQCRHAAVAAVLRLDAGPPCVDKGVREALCPLLFPPLLPWPCSPGTLTEP